MMCGSARRLVALSLAYVVGGCVPANPSASAIAGRWRAEWACGVETLDLEPDQTYVYIIEFRVGGRATDGGQWTVIASTERLSGARVVLHNALDACSAFGEKLARPERRDRSLEAIWEWGRTILSFNPDLPGFERSKAKI
jgi:hypothetical protein